MYLINSPAQFLLNGIAKTKLPVPVTNLQANFIIEKMKAQKF